MHRKRRPPTNSKRYKKTKQKNKGGNLFLAVDTLWPSPPLCYMYKDLGTWSWLAFRAFLCRSLLYMATWDIVRPFPQDKSRKQQSRLGAGYKGFLSFLPFFFLSSFFLDEFVDFSLVRTSCTYTDTVTLWFPKELYIPCSLACLVSTFTGPLSS